jgi:hypothetical protein
MIIRSEQLASFAERAETGLIDRMAVHLYKFFSSECSLLSKDEIRSLVHFGIIRAQSWGLSGERDVTRFVDLMLVLSPEFDADERFPWARTILQSCGVSPTIRIERVWAWALHLVEGAR